jgi:hypothetical protein
MKAKHNQPVKKIVLKKHIITNLGKAGLKSIKGGSVQAAANGLSAVGTGCTVSDYPTCIKNK